MAVQFKLPDIGEGVAEGEIVQWLVKVGDTIREDQALVEVMTDKVTAEIPAPVNGTITELNGQAGDVIAVGTVIAVIDTDGSAASSASTEKSDTGVASMSEQVAAHVPAASATATSSASVPCALKPSDPNKVLAAPATRKLARTLGVALDQVAGSGDRGRITPDDVRAATNGKGKALSTSPVTAPGRAAAVPADTTKPFSGIRRKIAERLSLSKQKAPHFAYVDEVDVTELVALRRQLKVDAEAQGIKLTYLPFVMAAVSRALSQFPVLNSTLDETKGEIIYRGAHNLGMAVDTPNGLVVPNIPAVQTQTVMQLAQQVNALADKARAGQLSPAEMSNGTFTLTSIGSIGGLFGVPIINYPEVAILGINSIVPRPVVRDGAIVIREILYLSLSCDHRIVDGADAARFMNVVKELLQSPARLLV